MNVALAYNSKKNKPSKNLEEQSDLEFDSPSVTKAQKDALESFGHKVILVNADEHAFLRLKDLKGKIDIVFNVAEGLWGEARESQIPLFCEVLKIPYTHSSPLTHAIALDKSYTKHALKGADVANVPASQAISSKDYKIDKDLKFPLIVKPNKEGSSKGVLDSNVVHDLKRLKQRIKEVSESFTKEIVVEEYIEGREFTVSLLGNDNPKILPIVEQRFDFLPKGMNKIASFELKWVYEDSLTDLKDAYYCPAKLSKALKKEIDDTSLEIYKFFEVRECARIDYRLGINGKLYFLEINTLPGMMPPEENSISYFPLAARTAGMNFTDLIGEILALACKRYGI